MTATLPSTSAPDRIWTIGTPRLLAGLEHATRLDHAHHLVTHGGRPDVTLDRLLELLDGARLTGRGGAGFPLAAKLRALHGGHGEVVVNGSESEPASWKDRTLLRRTPHLVLDGALSVAAALGTRSVTVAVHDAAAARSTEAALRERPDARRVKVVRTGGAFVAGEARALVRGLRGGPALPPGRRTPPTEHGALVANAETFAQLAVLLRLGARGYADTGTSAEPGTTLLTVSGAVSRPGVVEVPLGTPLEIVVRAAGAERPQAIVLGGYHGAWLTPGADVAIARNGPGPSVGAGIVLVVDDATCALGELARVSGWLAEQSARQCGPCRFGLPALAADVAAVAHGHPAATAHAARHLSLIAGRGACGHPDGAARFVDTGLTALTDELARHAAGGCGRPVLGQLPIGGTR